MRTTVSFREGAACLFRLFVTTTNFLRITELDVLRVLCLPYGDSWPVHESMLLVRRGAKREATELVIGSDAMFCNSVEDELEVDCRGCSSQSVRYWACTPPLPPLNR